MQYRKAQSKDIPEIYQLEKNGFPPDEAASLATIEFRFTQAKNCFLVAVDANNSIVAFINGTKTDQCEITEEMMLDYHIEDGDCVCIHSVVVDPKKQRQGIALRMLKYYLHWIIFQTKCSSVLLIAKKQMLPLYQKAGFVVLRVSPVVHGQEDWYELKADCEEKTRVFHINAFTEKICGGNKANVVVMTKDGGDFFGETVGEWMQCMAKELDAPATAFIQRTGLNQGNIRWFNGRMELELCGHATLASACALQTMEVLYENMEYTMRTGQTLKVKQDAEKFSVRLPKVPIVVFDAKAFHALLKDEFDFAVKDDIVQVGRNEYDHLVELTESAFLRLPKLHKSSIQHLDSRGIIFTTKGKDDFDFWCRYFNVSGGEDPATGSAHCYLGPYWAQKLGKSTLKSHQTSARGAHLDVTVHENCIELCGKTYLLSQGTLYT